ncbi:unnamed protein product, partial [Lymnaea stagnalis]
MELGKFLEDNVTGLFDRLQDRISNKHSLSTPNSPVKQQATGLGPFSPSPRLTDQTNNCYVPPRFYKGKKKDDPKDGIRQRSWTTDSE